MSLVKLMVITPNYKKEFRESRLEEEKMLAEELTPYTTPIRSLIPVSIMK